MFNYSQLNAEQSATKKPEDQTVIFPQNVEDKVEKQNQRDAWFSR